MIKSHRLFPGVLTAVVAAAMFALAAISPSQALAQGGSSLFTHEKYAAIVVDANTGEVLYARRADEQRFPASITKIMTLYLTFEALSTGRLSMNDKIVVSAHAAAQRPSKAGLRPGQSLPVDATIRAIAVISANDMAVAMAEHIAGSEAKFAELMTLRAQELGMTNTRFVNANGLPDARQVTTARDIAILSRAVMRDYPQYYAYFGVRSFSLNGRETANHNHLLAKMPGVDGLKTGFTNAAGFNLAASAVRNNKRLIAVVLGGSSTAARDENVEDLLNGGFEVMSKRSQGQNITLASTLHEPADSAGGPVQRPTTEMGSSDQAGLKIVVGDNNPLPASLMTTPTLKAAQDATVSGAPCVRAHGRGRHHRAASGNCSQATAAVAANCGAKKSRHHKAQPACGPEKGREVATAAAAKGKYIIQVGSFPSQSDAKAHLARINTRFSSLLNGDGQIEKAGKGRFRARFSGYSQTEAKQVCRSLSAKGERCLVIAGS